ncbi:MAG: phosphoribosylamine--glycine ligase [Alphaproteobacteria bacterium]
MKLLVIGNGGREHALCWALSASPLCDALYCAPGSDAIAEFANCISINADDCIKLIEFAKDKAIDLVVVGPELPLALGLVDQLEAAGIKAFGPSAAAARLETSKSFARDFTARHNIPGAEFESFSDLDAAIAYIQTKGAPIVVKADGLAGGKGVVVAQSTQEAVEAAKRLSKIGNHKLVIEECLIGTELSFFALCDGQNALPLISAKDHKRAFNNDQGPNTGGMGAYAPSKLADLALNQTIIDQIVTPTLKGMEAEGMPFQGVLFLGLMITENGPKLIEYNVRFGDPECQCLMMLLFSDLLPALIAATSGALNEFSLRWNQEKTAICIVLAANGYPDLVLGSHQPIPRLHETLERVKKMDGVEIFHAGTLKKTAEDGAIEWLATGGRVLNIVSVADSLLQARTKGYAIIEQLAWQGGFYRTDIGHN